LGIFAWLQKMPVFSGPGSSSHNVATYVFVLLSGQGFEWGEGIDNAQPTGRAAGLDGINS